MRWHLRSGEMPGYAVARFAEAHGRSRPPRSCGRPHARKASSSSRPSGQSPRPVAIEVPTRPGDHDAGCPRPGVNSVTRSRLQSGSSVLTAAMLRKGRRGRRMGFQLWSLGACQTCSVSAGATSRAPATRAVCWEWSAQLATSWQPSGVEPPEGRWCPRPAALIVQPRHPVAPAEACIQVGLLDARRHRAPPASGLPVGGPEFCQARQDQDAVWGRRRCSISSRTGFKVMVMVFKVFVGRPRGHDGLAHSRYWRVDIGPQNRRRQAPGPAGAPAC